MTVRTRLAITVAASLGLVTPAVAQQAPAPPPPIRALGPITAVTKDSIAAVSTAVATAGGKILLNDITAHRVLMFDSTLRTMTVVADSTGATANAYGANPATLLPFRGDSALLITPSSLSMLVLSPAGAITRTMAMPTSTGRGPLGIIGSIFGTPGFDAKGRLAFYMPIRSPFTPQRQSGGGSGPVQQIVLPVQPDSGMVARYDLLTRGTDTAGYVRISKSKTTPQVNTEGRLSSIQTTAFPPQTVDDWAVTSDGSIAFVRGRDYHIDWLSPDGTWSSTPRMSFAWERLSDDQKTALIDSVSSAVQEQFDSVQARLERQRAAAAAGSPVTVSGGDGADKGAAGSGGVGFTIVTRGGDGGGRGGPNGPATFSFPKTVVAKAELSDVPDYRPPFQPGSVRADLDGNLWIRTSVIKDGQPVYDIVNRKGEVIDRVQLPAFRRIAGFGHGVVFMGVRDSAGVAHLERARVK
ncbi:MAG TPA: hypothetical protein VGI83_01630 [Gemmatimonadales bacterium]